MQLSDEVAQACVKHWVEVLDIDNFFTLYVKVNNAPDTATKKRWQKPQAFIHVDGSYGHTKLTINAYNIEPEELDAVIAHELGHVILNDIDELLSDLAGKRLAGTVTKVIESTNERFAKALTKLYKRGISQKVKAKTK